MNLLIAVWVAPQEPYPELFANGPQQTWLRDLPPGVQAISVGGKKLSKGRRTFSDFRDQLRFAGPKESKVGTVDYDSFPQIVFRATLLKLHHNDHEKLLGFSKRVLQKILLATEMLITCYEQNVTSWRKNRIRSNFEFNDGHLTFDRAASISNSSALMLDFLNWFIKQTNFDGVLVTSTGAYVRPGVLLSFSEGLDPNIDMAISSAIPDSENSVISGFAIYFTKKGATAILRTSGLDHSLLNDVALSDWVRKYECRLTELPVLWPTNPDFTHYSKSGLSKSDFAVLRCTNHWDRGSETQLMHQFHSQLHNSPGI